jgi:hypothetical protein
MISKDKETHNFKPKKLYDGFIQSFDHLSDMTEEKIDIGKCLDDMFAPIPTENEEEDPSYRFIPKLSNKYTKRTDLEDLVRSEVFFSLD